METTEERGFEFFDHTADVGIRAYGRDLKELFRNASKGLLEIFADTSAIPREAEVEIEVEAPGLEELLVAWLEELIYQGETRGILFGGVEVWDVGENRVKGRAWGAPLEKSRELVRGEAKAVTYHMLQVRKEGEFWSSQVVVDV